MAASSLEQPLPIASQNTAKTFRRALPGRPGDRTDGRPVFLVDQPAGRPIPHIPIEVLQRPVGSAQYLSIRYTDRLADIGALASVGARGDSYDNAAAESQFGLYKTELNRRHGPWRGLDHVEVATLEWVDWFNHRRLHSSCGNIPPAEYEQQHYRQNTAPHPVAAAEPSLH